MAKIRVGTSAHTANGWVGAFFLVGMRIQLSAGRAPIARNGSGCYACGMMRCRKELCVARPSANSLQVRL